MMNLVKCVRAGLALGVISAIAAGTAQAGSIHMDLTIGATTISIDKGGFYDTASPLDPNRITVNTDALNATLAGLGYGNLTFTQLGTNSNNVGDPAGATLISGGDASVTSGSVSFTVVAYQTDFFIPSGSDGTMASSAGGSFTKTSTGDGTTFTSYFDPSNAAVTTAPPAIPSSPLAFAAPNTSSNAGYGNLNPLITPLGTVIPGYAVVNQLDITVSGSTSKVGDINFSGTTVIFAAVPEPTSVVMMLSAMPMALGLVHYRRRRMG